MSSWRSGRLLVSPEFLVRIEADPAGVAPDTPYEVTDLRACVSSLVLPLEQHPDDELLALAERGELSDPGTLERQVLRMVADPRSEALTENFVGQWLQLRNMATLSGPAIPIRWRSTKPSGRG